MFGVGTVSIGKYKEVKVHGGLLLLVSVYVGKRVRRVGVTGSWWLVLCV